MFEYSLRCLSILLYAFISDLYFLINLMGIAKEIQEEI